MPFDADTSVAIALKHINDPMPDAKGISALPPGSINKIIRRQRRRISIFHYKSAFNMYEDLQRCLSEA